MTIKKAFTLSEMLVSLAVLAVIATLLLPAIANKKPNKAKVMFKKSYYIAEKIVSELVNNDDLYPTEDDSAPGFTNETEVKIGSKTYSGNTKFCELFADKINTTGPISCTSAKATPSSSPAVDDGTLRTVDGVFWYIPIRTFTSTGAATDMITITVDVNGINAPNCKYNLDNCKNPDRFEVSVRFDGKMSISGVKEVEYLHTSNLY